jgi:putrescine transport system ATP-binding protein
VAAEPVKPEVMAAPPAKVEPLPEPDMPLLRIEGVAKKFGNFRAVDHVTLDIRAGEFFALLGPSGCGKTTLLRMLAGFETPDEGRILLNGRDIAPAARAAGQHDVPELCAVSDLTVKDNIA